MAFLKGHLNTAAGSTLLILLSAKDAPLREIKPMVVNIPSNIIGEKEKIRPELATPRLKPSNNNSPMRKPTTENRSACVRIRRLI